MDFGLLPPEVNSNRMFRGPGSQPMLAAATAWNALGSALYSTEISFVSAISGLRSEVWHGPAATSMAEAIRPLLAWIATASIRAHHTAAQARSAVAAYETALTAMVVPTQVTENRARLRALAAANRLAQCTPAIAAVEARYSEMWAQDAHAMYRYARHAAMATRLLAFPVPDAAGTPAADSGRSAPPGVQAALYGAVPQALDRLATPTAPDEPLSAPGTVDDPADWDSSSTASPMSAVAALASEIAEPDTGRRGTRGLPLPLPVQAWFNGCPAPGGRRLRATCTPATPDTQSHLGPAATVGGLSVPQAWVDTAPPRPAAIVHLLASRFTPTPHRTP
ncbi:PPE family protein [Mycobacterium paragordonae]|uniref:PPE family protein n=1 Tax=Mycobacterium paragordonae TaxID=1389713 RepID=A0AAJ1SD35_9MYCO|nr:PPE family protein [Mycobacterium paragordonae]MDP7739319.1 PPE family protein [Mycobacterium paragordonae]TDK94622.1 PPE family protein [Mycobacterium paragordonae]TDL04086.1 PPE family protein [Mycobacterium paragordonae]